MKNILYIELSSGFGGSSEALASMLKHLDRKEFHPIVLTAQDGPNFDKLKKADVETIQVKFRSINRGKKGIVSYIALAIDFALNTVPQTFAILSIVKRRKIDLIHINTNIKNNLHAILAARFAGIPCVCHMRGTRSLVKTERLFGKLVSKIIILNKKAFQNIAESFTKDKAVIIYDGLDLDKDFLGVDPARVKEEFSLNGSYCIGIIGRLVEGKGQDDFIKAAAIMKKRTGRIKFLIVGDDPSGNKVFESRLKAMAERLGLRKEIIFTGWRNDKEEVLASLDLLIQASSSFPEGAPLICIEGMAQAKPVVATNIAGSSEMVVDGVTGYLVPPANPGKLAAAMLKLKESYDRARKFGMAGRKRVEELFDVSKNVRRVEALYTQLIR